LVELLLSLADEPAAPELVGRCEELEEVAVARPVATDVVAMIAAAAGWPYDAHWLSDVFWSKQQASMVRSAEGTPRQRPSPRKPGALPYSLPLGSHAVHSSVLTPGP
jgi:hypothetical protein